MRTKERKSKESTWLTYSHMHGWLKEQKEGEQDCSNDHTFWYSLSCLLLETLLHLCSAHCTAKLHSLSFGERQFVLLPILQRNWEMRKGYCGQTPTDIWPLASEPFPSAQCAHFKLNWTVVCKLLANVQNNWVDNLHKCYPEVHKAWLRRHWW